MNLVSQYLANQSIAKWLEPEVEWNEFQEVDRLYTKSKGGAWWKGNGYTKEPADFFRDEAASALALDKLIEYDRAGNHKVTRNVVGNLFGNLIFGRRNWDRKTEIAHAALALIEREQR